MLINIHTHYLKKEKEEISVYSEYRDFNEIPDYSYLTLGIHPWYISENWKEQLNEIEQHLQENKLIAVGETGLDKIKGPSMELQLQVFEAHVHLSEKYQKPLIIHNVRASQELIEVRNRHRAKQCWMVHGFRNNQETAKMLVKHGCCLSLGLPLLKDDKLAEVLKNIPLENIFFETDDINGSVSVVYYHASQVLGIDLHALERQIQLNFETYFKVNLHE